MKKEILQKLRPKLIEVIDKSTCSLSMNPYLDVLIDINLFLAGNKGIISDPDVLIEAAEDIIKRGPVLRIEEQNDARTDNC